jgi:hypothetical protein
MCREDRPSRIATRPLPTFDLAQQGTCHRLKAAPGWRPWLVTGQPLEALMSDLSDWSDAAQPSSGGSQASSPGWVLPEPEADPDPMAPPPAYQAAAAPPATRTGRRNALIAVAAIISVLGLAGRACSIAALMQGHTSSPPVAAGHSHDGDLRVLLVSAPAEAGPCQDSSDTDELLNLEQDAANYTGTGNAADILRQSGFLRGATHCWLTAGGSEVDLTLEQFDSATHARHFLAGQIAQEDKQYGSTSANVPGIPGAKSYLDLKADANGNLSNYVFGQRGDIMFTIATWESPITALAADLTRQQYDRL